MSVSTSINYWNIIDSDSQSKSDKLDIIINIDETKKIITKLT